MEPMRTVIEGVQRRASDGLAVYVFHTDVPTNDFDPLFALLSSPDSYLRGCPTSSLSRRASLSTSGSSRRPDPHRLERDRGALAQLRPCPYPRPHLVQPGDQRRKRSLRPSVGRGLAILPRPPGA